MTFKNKFILDFFTRFVFTFFHAVFLDDDVGQFGLVICLSFVINRGPCLHFKIFGVSPRDGNLIFGDSLKEIFMRLFNRKSHRKR